MYDFIIKNANLYLGNGQMKLNTDIAIKDGLITKVETGIDIETTVQVYEAGGKLVVPGFMDTHMHIDKAFTMDNDATLSLIEACANSERQSDSYFGWSEEKIYEEIMEHAGKVVEMCIVHGTTLLKTNVLFTPTWKTLALKAMTELKEKYKDYITIQSCVGFVDEYREELLESAKRGEVDCIGGYPHLAPDHKAITDDCFMLAKKFNLPVDLHCDEADVINLDCFQYIIESTKKHGMEGKVTCGHVTALNATNISEEEAEKIIEEAAAVSMNVTSLTSCNMYLMNMTRRGPSRVRQLTEAGVNVAVASDNVRDTFRPFGNCDLLEEALLTAQVHKFGSTEWLRKTMDMVTYNPAKNAVAKNYGLDVGCKADLCIIDAPTPEEAILSRAKREIVMKGGKVVARNGVLIRDYISK